MPDLVIVETHDRVRTITLNRPEARNALDTPLQRASGAALAEADADDGSTSSSSPGPIPRSAPGST